MTIVNLKLKEELKHIAKPEELKHISEMLENIDPLMQDIAYGLIIGDQNTVGTLTKEALDKGYEANTVLDDGLISGMAVVGIKFRDNIIFVP